MSITYRVASVTDVKKLDILDLVSADEELSKYSRHKEDLFDVRGYFQRGGCFWVAEDNHKIVGMVGIRLSEGGEMKVKALRVHPDYRRQGIAKRLMKILENYCQEQGTKELILGVSKNSLPARTLYESLGYIKYKEKQFEPGKIIYYYKKEL
jgi:ribosomal protein S18 acetylase RimI-like enzyme